MCRWKEVILMCCICFKVANLVVQIKENPQWFPTQAKKSELDALDEDKKLQIQSDSIIHCRMVAISSQRPLHCMQHGVCHLYNISITRNTIVEDEPDRVECFTAFTTACGTYYVLRNMII